MSVRPAPVRIVDYANPELTPEAQAIVDAIAPLADGLRLERGALLDAARAETGLRDFGPTDFEERLDVYCAALRDEAGLSELGWFNGFQQLLAALKNRLLVEDLVARHPEILDVEIVAPVVICGLPRTGTTHLHNLISADDRWRSLPYWESLEPVLPAGQEPPAGSPDPRIARAEAGCVFVNTIMPLFPRMHEMDAWHVHEEIQLLMIDFSTMLMESGTYVPSWTAYYRAHDQTSSYRYMKKVLQCCQWLRGGTRWVLKSPQHLEQFPVLYDTFPDATFVVTHRDPVAVTASLVTMMAYNARMSAAHPDPERIAAHWATRSEQMLAACVRDRDRLPAERTVDVRFTEFMADDVAMVERIYERAGMPATARARAAMDAFMADHPRGRHGGLVYDLADFGLDRDERRRALSFYSERFGLEPEA